jgi:hypothetical protein
MPVARISPSPFHALEDELIQISANEIDSDILKLR